MGTRKHCHGKVNAASVYLTTSPTGRRLVYKIAVASAINARWRKRGRLRLVTTPEEPQNYTQGVFDGQS